MTNIKLTIEYDGTNYVGWQRQQNGISIQEQIEKAINKVTGEKVHLIGSGRTDKGVHAKGQVANFTTRSTIPPSRFKLALNNNLPEDIVILNSERVSDDFHSRYDAIGKKYKYLIYNNPIRGALYRNFAYQVPYHLDYKEMERAMNFFIGTHDFISFMVSKNNVRATTKTITQTSLKKKGNIIFFTIEGDGFLHNMVRIIVGTLVDIGRGKMRSSSVPHIISLKNRKFAGHTAPPQGLYLEKVYY